MADWKFARVDPDKITLAWDPILEGLLHIKRHNPAATFRPEDIYAALREAHAELFACYLDGEYVGFVILAETKEAFTLKPRLLVWCAYVARVPGNKNRLMPHPRATEINELADDSILAEKAKRGIKTSFFMTSRAGWDREAPRRGYRKYETTWIRED